MSILAYSPLAQGLLTGNVTADREFIEGDHRRGHPWFSTEFRNRIADALATVQTIADERDMTASQVVINWTVSEPGVTGALVGARKPAQAAQNAASLDTTLTDEERQAIRAAFADVAPPK